MIEQDQFSINDRKKQTPAIAPKTPPVYIKFRQRKAIPIRRAQQIKFSILNLLVKVLNYKTLSYKGQEQLGVQK